jgi:hemerythrin-like domain-containing protein
MPRKTKSTKSTKPAPDAIKLLKEDHQEVKQLLEKLEKSGGRGKSRDGLLAKIENQIKIHSLVEEEIFYPAYKETARKKEDQKLFYEAAEEHHIVDVVLSELSDEMSSAEEFAAKAKLLKELVEHHVKEEEREMFPRARKQLGAERLRELGQQIEERKQQLQSEGLQQAS